MFQSSALSIDDERLLRSKQKKRQEQHKTSDYIIMIRLLLDLPSFHVSSSFSSSFQSPRVLHCPSDQRSVYGVAVFLRQSVQLFQQAQRRLQHVQHVSFLLFQIAERNAMRGMEVGGSFYTYLLFSLLDLSGLFI